MWIGLRGLLLVLLLVTPSMAGELSTLGIWPPIIELNGGLKYQDLVVGQGSVAHSDQTVAVHYIGTLEDGTEFDNSRKRNRPFLFPLGRGKVIVGWDLGIAGMAVGGKRRLIVPPDMAYGDSGAGDLIPPGATLVFEVDLLSVH